jgi:hypothetical protein
MQIAGANEIPTGSFPLATRWDLVLSGYNQVINHLPAGSFSSFGGGGHQPSCAIHLIPSLLSDLMIYFSKYSK